MKGVSFQMRLEGGAKESVTGSGQVEDPQVHVEDGHVQDDRKGNQTHCPGQEVLNCVTLKCQINFIKLIFTKCPLTLLDVL